MATLVSDRLLSEIDRQKKYLAKLPNKFEFSLFNAMHALESQRRNGYRNTAAATREIVDNAMEAGAKQIHVVFNKSTKGREIVKSVAIIDNGPGMLPKMARYALSWGGGTHFDEPNFIGRFGFGLPNASINQTRRVEVFTRTDPKDKITKAWLDADDFPDTGLQTISEPTTSELPDFVKLYLAGHQLSFETGTVVVWVEPDRLTYKTASSLREHLLDDFGTTYRYLLGDLELKVDGMRVEAVDPLFLTPTARYYVGPDEEGPATEVDQASVPAESSFATVEANDEHAIEQAPSNRWTADQITSRSIAGDLLDQMPEDAANAAWLVYALSSTVSDAARQLNRSRFQVARDLQLVRRYVIGTAKPEQMRLAAAA